MVKVKKEKGRGESVKRGKKRRKIGETEEKGRKVRIREKRKLGRRTVTHTANVVGIMPAMSRPLLHKKRPCSNRIRKHKKCGTKMEI